jgi:predicted small secreted protein
MASVMRTALLLGVLLAASLLAGCTGTNPMAGPGTPVSEPQAHVHPEAAHEHPPMEEAHDHEAGADEEHLEHGTAGDVHGHEQTGMQRPAFPPAQGKVPASGSGLKSVGSLFLDGDRALADANLTGSGTLADPYVLRGLHVTGTLELSDTDACVVVAENYIDGQLALNWNGQCLHVHHNFVRDLRVNENVARTGYATGGLMEMNKIAFVGQLRHYDGEFRDNVVGPHTASDVFDQVLETTPYGLFWDPRVANIDGFNQGDIHHNTFHGSVDLDFHGHHHGSGFFAPHSHYHGDAAAKAHAAEDHADRWTSVRFTDNRIIDPEGYGLRYEDQNHAGDDRTATSETTEALDYSHVHHEDFVIARNHVDGGKIWVDMLGAPDGLHKGTFVTMAIEDNLVQYQERMDDDLCLVSFGGGHDPRSALHVDSADSMTLALRRNVVEYTPYHADVVGDPLGAAAALVKAACPFDWGLAAPTGIWLRQLSRGNVTLEDNQVTGAERAVGAALFTEVGWTVRGLVTDAPTKVWTDGSAPAPAE